MGPGAAKVKLALPFAGSISAPWLCHAGSQFLTHKSCAKVRSLGPTFSQDIGSLHASFLAQFLGQGH